jgi:hypothetical protein
MNRIQCIRRLAAVLAVLLDRAHLARRKSAEATA